MDSLSQYHLDDLFFEKAFHRYIEDPLYIKRSWLVERVERQLREPSCRFVLIVGEPGIGKTAFMASLAQTHPDWPRYFFRHDSQEPLRNGSLHSFFQDIGFQLSAIHPDLFNPDNLTMIVSQEVGTVVSGGMVKGINIAELYASPFWKQIVSINQRVGSVNGGTLGADIQRLVADDYLLDEEKLAFLALLGPARVLRGQRPDITITILVDALDESPYHSNVQNSLVRWLTHCEALPGNIRFIITSRPDEALRLFRMRQNSRLKEELLSPLSFEVRKYMQMDLRSYAEKFVAQETIHNIFEFYPLTPSYFVDKVVEKAEGNFLFLDTLFQAIAAARNNDDDEQLLRLLELEDLPSGLNNLYAFFLELLRQKSLEVGNDWETVMLPILEILAVAKEPLNGLQIKLFIARNVQQSIIQKALRQISQFLDLSDQHYSLYHGTFAEFLTNKRTEEHYPDYYLERSYCNQRIVRYYQAQAQQTEIIDWSRLDSYGLKYLALHMLEANQQEDLYKLIALGGSQNRWADFHLEKGGSYAGFLRDLDLFWQHASSEDGWSIGRQLRCVLLKSSIHSLTGNLIPELIPIYIQWKRFTVESALAYISEIPERYGYQRSKAIKIIAPLLLAKHTEPEDKLMEELLRMAEALANDSSIEQEEERLGPICLIFKHLPRETREKLAPSFWERLQTLKSERLQAQLIVTLWSAFPEYMLQQIFEQIQALLLRVLQGGPPQISLADILLTLVSSFSPDQRAEILQLVDSIGDEQFHLLCQARLFQYWNNEQKNNILERAIAATNQLVSVLALINLLPFLSEQQRLPAANRAWQIIRDNISGPNITVKLGVLDGLCSLIHYLPVQRRREAADAVWKDIPLTSPYIFKKAETLFKFVPLLPVFVQNSVQEQAVTCVHIAINDTKLEQISDEQMKQRILGLITLFPYLTDSQKQEVLLLIERIAHPGERALVMLEIVREDYLQYLPRATQERLISALESVTITVGDERERATVFAQLANICADEPYILALYEARRIINSLPEKLPMERDSKGRALLGLVAYFPFEERVAIIRQAVALMSGHLTMREIAGKLIDYLDIPLDDLVPHLSEDLQQGIGEILGTNKIDQDESPTHAISTSSMSNLEKTEQICQVLLSLKEKGYNRDCQHLLEVLLEHWDGSLFFSDPVCRETWCQALQASARRLRNHCMLDFLAITLLLFHCNIDAVSVRNELLQALLDVERWWP